jgi:hypothetical protein
LKVGSEFLENEEYDDLVEKLPPWVWFILFNDVSELFLSTGPPLLFY